MASKLCDSCKLARATLFCRADSAFLCVNCDTKIHAANKLASRHSRVWVCEVCEQAPAHVTCKADAAALCVTCDRDIHSANPLSRRHERVPVTPFYDSAISSSAVKHNNNSNGRVLVNFLDEDRYFDEVDGGGGGGGDASREEAEAASWLLPDPKLVDLNTGQAQEHPYVFSDLDPYLDLDYVHVDPKLEVAQEQNSSGADGVVPVQSKNLNVNVNKNVHHLVNDACFDLDFSGSYSYEYNNSRTQRLSKSVSSSSSLDVGVVPDGGNQTVQISWAEREARVLRYREKRKNRKFEKTIRYASRKAYAETRPRIKGRFVKRTDINAEAAAADDHSSRSSSIFIYGFDVVPSF